MKTKREASSLLATIDGPIGESTPLFSLPLSGVKDLVLDLKGVTYINSIGVKQWILWTVRIPKDCKVRLQNAPFVIATQASVVLGFAPPSMTLESVVMPFVCESCGAESMRTLLRGPDYDYSGAGKAHFVAPLSGGICNKCRKPTVDPDFIIDKTFKFLN